MGELVLTRDGTKDGVEWENLSQPGMEQRRELVSTRNGTEGRWYMEV